MDKELTRLRKELPSTALDYLDGNDKHTNGSWATLLAIAVFCITAGLVFQEFRHLVFESAFADSTSLMASGKRERRCQDAWERAQEYWTPGFDKEGVRKYLADLVIEVEAHPWKGRGGHTDRAVITSIINHCHELGTYSPVLSARFLAERTSLGLGTISRSLQRLTKLDLIGYTGKTSQNNSHYRVNLWWKSPTKVPNGTSSSVPSTCSSTSLHVGDVPRHDAFVSKSLGTQCGRIYFTMSEPMTAAQAATAFGVTPKSARKYLDDLVKVGLATKAPGRPAVYTMVDVSVDRLNEIATEYGTLGWHDNQKAQHENHREAHNLIHELRRKTYGSAILQTASEDQP